MYYGYNLEAGKLFVGLGVSTQLHYYSLPTHSCRCEASNEEARSFLDQVETKRSISGEEWAWEEVVNP